MRRSLGEICRGKNTPLGAIKAVSRGYTKGGEDQNSGDIWD